MDLNLLVEKVTAEVMKILAERVTKPRVLIQEDTTDKTFLTALEPHCQCVSPGAKEQDWDFILLSKAEYEGLQKTTVQPSPVVVQAVPTPSNKNVLDFTRKKLVTEKEIRSICFSAVTEILVAKKTIVTPAARDLLKSNGISIVVRDAHV